MVSKGKKKIYIYVFGRCRLSIINLHLLQQTWLKIVSWSPLKIPRCVMPTNVETQS